MSQTPPRLTRQQLGEFLRGHGYPIGNSTLVKLCVPSINEGPPVSAFWGNRPLYDPDAALAWAEARCHPTKGEPTATSAAKYLKPDALGARQRPTKKAQRAAEPETKNWQRG
jgi:hypothetical protein